MPGGWELGLPAEQHEHRVDVAHEQTAAGAEHTGQLAERCAQIRDVDEGEGADGGVDRPVRQWQVGEGTVVKGGAGQLGAGDGEHVPGLVDSDDFVAPRREVGGVATRAAGGVEDAPRW